MEGEGIAAITSVFLSVTVGPWVYVFFVNKPPPQWEVEKDKIIVRVKSEKNDMVHTYVSDFLSWDRSYGSDNSLVRKNSDVFSLFYTKKLLFNLIFLFSTVFLALTLIMYSIRIEEIISHKIPFNQIFGTGSNIDTFVLMCVAFFLLSLPALALGFVYMRHIEGSLEILKNRRETLN